MCVHACVCVCVRVCTGVCVVVGKVVVRNGSSTHIKRGGNMRMKL